MPPTRSPSSLTRAASRDSSLEKSLPSLNELFPEDLFRGAFSHPHTPSSAPSTSQLLPLAMPRAVDGANQCHRLSVRVSDEPIHELSPELPPTLTPIPSQAPPRSPSDAHPVSPGGRRSPVTIAERSHPHPHPHPNPVPLPLPLPPRGHPLTPSPPSAAATPSSPSDCAAACCNPSGTFAQLHTHTHMRRTTSMYHSSETAPPPQTHSAAASMTAGRTAPAGPSAPAYSTQGQLPHATARSAIWNPADELVSVITNGGRAPFAQNPHPPHVSRRPHGPELERVHGAGTESVRPGLFAGSSTSAFTSTSTSTNSRAASHHQPSATNPGHASPSALGANSPLGLSTNGSCYPRAASGSMHPASSPTGRRGKGRHNEDPAQQSMNDNAQARDARTGSASASAADGPGRGKASPATDDSERRHCCTHCNKRFNRPSSLAIHVNTHTGAKPFTCAYPGCDRKFNVNSNMRRHYRNHLNARRRDAATRMVQQTYAVPPGPAVSSSAHPLETLSQQQRQRQHAQGRSSSIPESLSTSGSPSVSRSPSYSPSQSPMSSRSPSPLPSPVSAVTSPFPPTPRSLPSTSFRAASPEARLSQHTPQPYLQHHQSRSQPPVASAYTYLSAPKSQQQQHPHHLPSLSYSQATDAPSPPWSTSEYDPDETEAPCVP
ncbi:hypothetical protein BN946_scf184817.g37 [Trametes cinnabarina]|uniref:C2H2-type domain-containing protein n=1 Tax=Pycnoporus cinnabarinus TaxID=5643 RepID=A0A060S4V1_PYCCI|nr:hypothetical protein BN946_scf184817.g37 [Trametes cinnabarina]